MKTKIVFLAAFILLISSQNAFSFTSSDNGINKLVGTPVTGFIENKGQLCDVNYNPAPYLLFKLQEPGTDVYITDWGLSYVFKHYLEKPQNLAAGNNNNPDLPDDEFKPKDFIIHYCRADMELAGANIRKENIIKEFESADYYNYYLPHCPDGVMEVRSYGKITIKDVYPGIDWVIYNSTSTGMKYDFVVHPYADPSQIKLRYKWTDTPEELDGSITMNTPLGIITEGKPYACNSGTDVNINYIVDDKDISFQTGYYNPSETLTIDPQLLWATYYGGTGSETGNSIHIDGTSVWVTGYTSSTDFPLQSLSGAYNQEIFGGGNNDVFILKFTAAITGINLISNEIPSSYSLSQNYPNPFNPKTIINYQLAINSEVILKVFDISGKEIAVLVNQKQNAGTYQVEWNASDYSSGIYFYKLETLNYSETKKMILMK